MTPHPTDERPYAIYARLSRKKAERPGARRARADDETVERQVRETKAYAVERGLVLSEAHVYIDNHFSAWKRKGGKRPAWRQLMAAASGGEVRGVLVWKLDRFTRAPRDMEDLIDLAEDHGVTIDGPHSGRLDMRTGAGRQQARGAAGQAAAESDNTSERVRAVFADARSHGELLGGGRVFGFEHAGDASVQRPDEVAILRDSAVRLLAGEPLAWIADELNDRGVLTPRGKPWTGPNLGRSLGLARMGGVIEYEGEVVGHLPGEPILDRETYDAVQAMLASRRRGRRASDRYLLTGLLRCGREGCGRNLCGATVGRRGGPAGTVHVPVYRCPACCLAVRVALIAPVIRDAALALYADPNTIERIAERDAKLDAARAEAEAEVARVLDQITNLELKLAESGGRTQRAYDAAMPVWLRNLAAAELERDALAAPASAAPAELPQVDAEIWDAATVGQRRGLILNMRMTITVMPVPPDRPRNRFDPTRVRIVTPATA